MVEAMEKKMSDSAAAEALIKRRQRRSEVLHFTAHALSGLSRGVRIGMGATEEETMVAAQAVRIGKATMAEFEESTKEEA